MKFNTEDIIGNLNYLIKLLFILIIITSMFVIISNQIEITWKILSTLLYIFIYFLYSSTFNKYINITNKITNTLNYIINDYNILLRDYDPKYFNDRWMISIVRIIIDRHNKSLRRYLFSIIGDSILIHSVLLMFTIICSIFDSTYISVILIVTVALHNITLLITMINQRSVDTWNDISGNTRSDLNDHIKNIKNYIENGI